jgi:hypothetical protein
MLYKGFMDNLTKLLIEQYGRDKAWIMWRLGCSDQAVENWLAGQKPSRVFQNMLRRLVKFEQARQTKVKA